MDPSQHLITYSRSCGITSQVNWASEGGCWPSGISWPPQGLGSRLCLLSTALTLGGPGGRCRLGSAGASSALDPSRSTTAGCASRGQGHIGVSWTKFLKAKAKFQTVATLSCSCPYKYFGCPDGSCGSLWKRLSPTCSPRAGTAPGHWC